MPTTQVRTSSEDLPSKALRKSALCGDRQWRIRTCEPAGFTLIELLVVIAILAVLAALLVPATARVLASANASKCVANLRGLGSLVHSYAADNDGNIFPDMLTWDSGLMDYLNAKDRLGIWRCPADKAPRNGSIKWPSDPTLIAPPRSYVGNIFTFNLGGSRFVYEGQPRDTPAKLQSIPKPGNFWILTEWHPDKANANGFVVGNFIASVIGNPGVNVHGAGLNALMLDGHVENHTAKDGDWWWGRNRQ